MLKILVIDDRPTQVQILQRLLFDHDLTVQMDPVRAVEHVIGDAWYDVVICDVNMPMLNGFDVFDRVKHMPDRPAFIMISGGEVPCALIGDGFLPKPIDGSDLREMVTTLAGRRAAAITRRLGRIIAA